MISTLESSWLLPSLMILTGFTVGASGNKLGIELVQFLTLSLM